MSTVSGEHTTGGLVIVTIGLPEVEMVTELDSADVQPPAFVTVKVKTPPGRFVTVLLIPVPETVTRPGKRVITQVPVEGNPLNATLPEGTARVG